MGDARPDDEGDARRAIGGPSPFFLACLDELRASAAVGPLLDLACGRGRHALAGAELGLEVLIGAHPAHAF